MPGVILWSGIPIMGDARGTSYTVHCGTALGFLPIMGGGTGSYKDIYRGNVQGLLPSPYRGGGVGLVTPYYIGKTIAAVPFIFIGKGEGISIPIEIHGEGVGLLNCPYGRGEGLTYNPRQGSYDLMPILMYLENFLPELDGPLPAPFPPQEKVSLHVLYSKQWSFLEYNDRDNWCLLGMNYEGKPVAIFRRAPASSFPLRTVVNRDLYMRAITHLGNLWGVRTIAMSLPGEDLTAQQLREATSHSPFRYM
jgi:hypothetical protein